MHIRAELPTPDPVQSGSSTKPRAYLVDRGGAMTTVKDFAKQNPSSGPNGADDQHATPVPGTAPIKTPNPTDVDPKKPAREVPKVGSQDAPGG